LYERGRLSDEVHDDPTVLTTLKMVETEVGQFSTPDTTAEQNSNNRSVSLTFKRFAVGRLPHQGNPKEGSRRDLPG
jgi:hypothetical protein